MADGLRSSIQNPVTDEQLSRLALQSFEYQVMFLQEMDAADFNDLSSQRWHVGVVSYLIIRVYVFFLPIFSMKAVQDLDLSLVALMFSSLPQLC